MSSGNSPSGDDTNGSDRAWVMLLEGLSPVERARQLEAQDASDPALAARLRNLLHPGQDTASVFAAAAPRGSAAHLRVGDRIGPYVILDTLGEGGFGTVYKAEQREPFRRTVALKIIKPGFDTREIIARFASERQALARMNHPHIAGVLDAGATEEGRPHSTVPK